MTKTPEQLFAVGYAACFEGALGVVARREKAETGDASIDSRVNATRGNIEVKLTANGQPVG